MKDDLFAIGATSTSRSREVREAREVYKWYHDYLPPIPTLFNKKLGDGESPASLTANSSAAADTDAAPVDLSHHLLTPAQHRAISELADEHTDSPGHVLMDKLKSHPLLSGIEEEAESGVGAVEEKLLGAAADIAGIFSKYNKQTGVPKQEAPKTSYLLERGAFGIFSARVTKSLNEENPPLETPADYHLLYQRYLEDSEKDGRFGEKIIGFTQLSELYNEDTIFGWLRLAGTNPRVLQRLTPERCAALLEKMALTDAQVAAVAGDGATVDAEVAASRLYVCDYALLNGLPLQEGRHMPAAIGIFWSNAAQAETQVGRQLLPVAIQLGQDKGDPISTPGDEDWAVARILFSTADFNYHEMGTHLSAAHFAQEAFMIATRRSMPESHPVAALLIQIYYGLLFNNALGRMQLVNPGGFTDEMMAADLKDGSLAIVRNFYTDVWTWDHWNLRTFLTEQGTIDTDALPVYPYRDDGLPLWDAIRGFATSYVDAYYAGAADVAGDRELREWVEELVAPDKGNLATKGFPTELTNKADLAEVLARLIWQAGPGHGGINYSQYQYFAVVPSAPGAAYATSGDVMSVLPPLNKAIQQVDILNTLTQKIFDGPMGTFESSFIRGLNQQAKNAVEDYQRALGGCADQVDARNKTIARAFLKYPFLSPKNLPNSTNI